MSIVVVDSLSRISSGRISGGDTSTGTGTRLGKVALGSVSSGSVGLLLRLKTALSLLCVVRWEDWLGKC
jgi:hypothetical protein